MMLAQSIEAVPSDFWKNFCIALIALIAVTGIIVGIYVGTRKPEPTRINDDPPVEVRKAPKRFNWELAEQRHADHERRLVDLEQRSSDLLAKLDGDKQEILDAGHERGVELRAEINDVRRELDKKIDAVPDRVIATLKNTGAI